jgi:3-oxoacyl-(acyl-carrier-protein) synthase
LLTYQFALQQLQKLIQKVLEPHEVRRMDRSQQLAMIAAREAWADAGNLRSSKLVLVLL